MPARFLVICLFSVEMIDLIFMFEAIMKWPFSSSCFESDIAQIEMRA